MTTVTLDIPAPLYERLHREAEQAGQALETVAVAWLVERSRTLPHREDHPPEPAEERERARQALSAAGLLSELGPDLRRRAEQSTATIEEVQAAFARAGGTPLSEIIDEMRGPRG